MGQVLALEQHPDPELLGQAAALGDRGGAAAVVVQDPVELGVEGRVGPGRPEGLLELDAGRHQRLGDEPAAELAEPAGRAGVAHDRRRSLTRSCQSKGPDVPIGPPVVSVATRPGLAPGPVASASAPGRGAGGGDEVAQLARVLDPRGRLDPAGHIDPPGWRWAMAAPTFSGRSPPDTISRLGIDHSLGQAPVEQLARTRGWPRRSGGSGRRTRANRSMLRCPAGKALMVQLVRPAIHWVSSMDSTPWSWTPAQADLVGDLDHPLGGLVPEDADGHGLVRQPLDDVGHRRRGHLPGRGGEDEPDGRRPHAHGQQRVGLGGDPADLDERPSRSSSGSSPR